MSSSHSPIDLTTPPTEEPSPTTYMLNHVDEFLIDVPVGEDYTWLEEPLSSYELPPVSPSMPDYSLWEGNMEFGGLHLSSLPIPVTELSPIENLTPIPEHATILNLPASIPTHTTGFRSRRPRIRASTNFEVFQFNTSDIDPNYNSAPRRSTRVNPNQASSSRTPQPRQTLALTEPSSRIQTRRTSAQEEISRANARVERMTRELSREADELIEMGDHYMGQNEERSRLGRRLRSKGERLKIIARSP